MFNSTSYALSEHIYDPSHTFKAMGNIKSGFGNFGVGALVTCSGGVYQRVNTSDADLKYAYGVLSGTVNAKSDTAIGGILHRGVFDVHEIYVAAKETFSPSNGDTSVTLSYTPKAGTVEVYVDDSLNTEWSIDGDDLTGFSAFAGTESVDVYYGWGAKKQTFTSTTSCDCEEAIKEGTLSVYDGDTKLTEGSGDDYTVNYTTGVITLASSPSGTVTVRYLTSDFISVLVDAEEMEIYAINKY